MMTDGGTFVINGTERVVVSQLVRSPGVYYDMSIDKATGREVWGCKVIPSRGAWLEFEVDKRGLLGVRVDRKRKQHMSVLYRALERHRVQRRAPGPTNLPNAKCWTHPYRTRRSSISSITTTPWSARWRRTGSRRPLMP